MSSKETYEISRVTWRGIALEIRHCRNWCAIVGMDHIEVESAHRVALPITETGYRSHFIVPERIDEFGEAVGYVLAWLDHESRSREWRRREADARQLSLF